MVRPESNGPDLLQVAMESFEFDRITQVINTESALDQLCFNSFDLIILADGLASAAISDLVQSIHCNELASTPDLTILCLSDPDGLTTLNNKSSDIQFCPSQAGLSVLGDDLRQTFRRALERKSASTDALGWVGLANQANAN